MPPERGLLPGGLRRALATTCFGRRIYYIPEVDSTNRLAAELAGYGEAEGTLVITEFQNAGRGQQQRRWLSPPHRNLLFSLILRPHVSSRELLPITLAFAVTAAEVLSGFVGERLEVKWPNDVIAATGKLGGILAESSSKAGRASYVIVGIGLNINLRPGELPRGVEYPAASCRSLTGRDHDRIKVLAALLGALEPAYQRFVADGFAPFVAPYGDRLSLREREVELDTGGGSLRGTVTGVGDDGGLIIRTGAGVEQVVYEGRVRRI